MRLLLLHAWLKLNDHLNLDPNSDWQCYLTFIDKCSFNVGLVAGAYFPPALSNALATYTRVIFFR